VLENAPASLSSVRILDLLAALDSNDLRTSLTIPQDIQELTGLLNDIFFVGSLAKVDFTWSVCNKANPAVPKRAFCGVLADMETKFYNGGRKHKMLMHPTRTWRQSRR
jgi:hypothetical protein